MHLLVCRKKSTGTLLHKIFDTGINYEVIYYPILDVFKYPAVYNKSTKILAGCNKTKVSSKGIVKRRALAGQGSYSS